MKTATIAAALFSLIATAARAEPTEFPPLPAAKPVITIQAAVSISRQKMDVLVLKEGGDAEIYNWTVSTGRKGYETPTGTYKPTWLSKNHRSKTYDDAPMPFAVFFHGGYAVHATFAEKNLGRPASHGCVRLSQENAEAFFSMVAKHGKANTEIIIVQ